MKLNYKKIGQGDPLIILHGLFGASDNWVSIGRQLANHYTVYLIDQRNHGDSPHSNVFTYEAMAQDIQEFMTSEGLQEAIVIGHSMGGKTAMTLATGTPNLVTKLVVVDIAPKAYPVHHDTIIKGLQSIPLHNLTSRQQADIALAEYVPLVSVRQFLLKNLKRTPEGFAWKINLDIIATEIEQVGKPLLSRTVFDKPVLFLRGGMSNYIDVEGDMPLIKAHFPNAVIKTIKGASHWVHAEKPEQFLQELTMFL